MKLLVFGGTFDPPHVGHMSLLANAIAAVQPDAVVVVPASTPPHKQGSETPAPIRLALCECFRPLFKGLVISDMELRRGGKSYTIDTVRALQAQHPGADIYLCIGSDMLLTFTGWYRYKELLAEVTLVAQNRYPGEGETVRATAAALRKEGGRILFAQGVTQQVSSSEIRAALAAGQDVYDLIPPPADALVRKMGLYQ